MMEDALETAARQMLSYFGSQATEVQTRRARDLAGSGDWPAQDRALLLLNRMESLTRPSFTQNRAFTQNRGA